MTHTRVERPEKPLRKCLKIGVGFMVFGVDLACIFWTGKKGQRLSGKSAPECVPSKIHRGVPTLVPSVLAHSGIVFWTLGLKDPGKCP